MVTINLLQHKDIQQAEDFIKNTIKSLPYYNDAAKEAEIRKYTKDSLDKFIVFVAKSDENIIGFIIASLDDGLIWIDWIGVDSEFRGKGIAKQLLNHIEQYARDNKVHKIWCDCRTNNSLAQMLWVSAGYNKITTLINHWHGQDFYLWGKLLQSCFYKAK